MGNQIECSNGGFSPVNSPSENEVGKTYWILFKKFCYGFIGYREEEKK
jgi:hypothetical protein